MACPILTVLTQAMRAVWITDFGSPVVPEVKSRYQGRSDGTGAVSAGPPTSIHLARSSSSVRTDTPSASAVSRAVATKAASVSISDTPTGARVCASSLTGWRQFSGQRMIPVF